MAIVQNPGSFEEARDYVASKLFNTTFAECDLAQKKFINKVIEDYIDKGSGRADQKATVGELYEIPQNHFATYINIRAAQWPDVAAVALKIFNSPAYTLNDYNFKLCVDTAAAIKTVYSPNVTDGMVAQFLAEHPHSILYGKNSKDERGLSVVSSFTVNARQSEQEVTPEPEE